MGRAQLNRNRKRIIIYL